MLCWCCVDVAIVCCLFWLFVVCVICVVVLLVVVMDVDLLCSLFFLFVVWSSELLVRCLISYCFVCFVSGLCLFRVATCSLSCSWLAVVLFVVCCLLSVMCFCLLLFLFWLLCCLLRAPDHTSKVNNARP